jgi:hypothetical protein
VSNVVRNPRTRPRALLHQLKLPRVPPTQRCARGGTPTPPDLISTPRNHPTELPSLPKIRASCSPPSTTHLGEFHSSCRSCRSSGSQEKKTHWSLHTALSGKLERRGSDSRHGQLSVSPPPYGHGISTACFEANDLD